MMLHNVTLKTLDAAAAELVQYAGMRKLWTIEGVMGAGKTTLVQHLCRQLGVRDEVSSPTFSLVNEYKTSSGQRICHFDFYRIKSIEEVYDMGYEEYFYSGDICIIEWPGKIKELLAGESVFEIKIEFHESSRNIIAT